jgi:hypothetical protein
MTRARRALVMVTTMISVLAGMVGITGQASAAERSVGRTGHEARCDAAGHLLCLYYLDNETEAYWGTSSSRANLDGIFFRTAGIGQGQPVKNDSNSAMCASTARRCRIYTLSGFTGNVDILFGNQVGNLSYAHNNNESVSVEPI